MRTVRLLKIIAVPALAALAGGCLGGGSAPSEHLTLTPASVVPAGTARNAASGESVAVLTPTVPREVNNRRIAVYVDPITIQYLTRGTWLEEPQELFRRLLSETIASRTGRLVIDPNNFGAEAAVTVSGQLLRFGFDPTTMSAVVVYEAAQTRRGQPLQTQRFEARVPVTAQTAVAVAPALNDASNQVAVQVADWIGG